MRVTFNANNVDLLRTAIIHMHKANAHIHTPVYLPWTTAIKSNWVSNIQMKNNRNSFTASFCDLLLSWVNMLYLLLWVILSTFLKIYVFQKAKNCPVYPSEGYYAYPRNCIYIFDRDMQAWNTLLCMNNWSWLQWHAEASPKLKLFLYWKWCELLFQI